MHLPPFGSLDSNGPRGGDGAGAFVGVGVVPRPYSGYLIESSTSLTFRGVLERPCGVQSILTGNLFFTVLLIAIVLLIWYII